MDTDLTPARALMARPTTAFTPAPPSGTTVAYDGFGFDPKDWYVDETPTLGGPNVTVPGTIPSSLTDLTGELDSVDFVFRATQDFEDLLLGDEVIAIQDWKIENTSPVTGIFSARSVNDVLGAVEARGLSTRWIRIRDQAGDDTINQVTGPALDLPPGEIVGYSWTFWINLEEPPGSGPNYPNM